MDHLRVHVSGYGGHASGVDHTAGANAIYHATGKRVREASITLDKLL